MDEEFFHKCTDTTFGDGGAPTFDRRQRRDRDGAAAPLELLEVVAVIMRSTKPKGTTPPGHAPIATGAGVHRSAQSDVPVESLSNIGRGAHSNPIRTW